MAVRRGLCRNCGEPIERVRNRLTEWAHRDAEADCWLGADPNTAPEFSKVIDSSGRIHFIVDDNKFPLCGAEITAGNKARTTCIYCMGKVREVQ